MLKTERPLLQFFLIFILASSERKPRFDESFKGNIGDFAPLFVPPLSKNMYIDIILELQNHAQSYANNP